jgi:hypothetical protein
MDTETICTIIGFTIVIVALFHMDYWPPFLNA